MVALRLAVLGRATWTVRGGLRGGSWNNNPQNLRAAYRNNNNPHNRNNNVGFRVAVGWQYDFRLNFQGQGSGERAFFVQGRTRRSWPGQVVCARYRRGPCLGLRATGAAVLFTKAGKLGLPLIPALSRKGRGGSAERATTSLLPLREKDRMRGGPRLTPVGVST